MAWSKTSRHERGYGTAWDKLRVHIMNRDAGICQPCLRRGILHAGTEVDHIIPKAKGGTDDEGNLECICSTAHREKTARETGKTPRQAIGADGWPM